VCRETLFSAQPFYWPKTAWNIGKAQEILDNVSLKIGTKLIIWKSKFYPSQITGKLHLTILPCNFVLSSDNLVIKSIQISREGLTLYFASIWNYYILFLRKSWKSKRTCLEKRPCVWFLCLLRYTDYLVKLPGIFQEPRAHKIFHPS
jgi:hypothetical protein